MFEYDSAKSSINKQKHGIDFESAKELWDDPGRTIIPARTVNETRPILIGRIKNNLWTAVFTIRNKNIRIISVRKARKNEREIYHSV